MTDEKHCLLDASKMNEGNFRTEIHRDPAAVARF